jgi:hypothetical protein
MSISTVHVGAGRPFVEFTEAKQMRSTLPDTTQQNIEEMPVRVNTPTRGIQQSLPMTISPTREQEAGDIGDIGLTPADWPWEGVCDKSREITAKVKSNRISKKVACALLNRFGLQVSVTKDLPY